MTAASRRARRPSALRAVGNPADVAPGDEVPEAVEPTEPAAETAKPAATDAAVPAVAVDVADEEAADDAQVGASPEKPAPARRSRRKAETPAPADEGATATPAAGKRTAGRSRGKAGDAGPDAIKAEVAETAGRADRGRPRVPREGPVTRWSLDLAVSEAQQVEQLAGAIGRRIGRGSGRSRIRGQHVARVALRRALADPEVRALIEDDLAHNRDHINRPS